MIEITDEMVEAGAVQVCRAFSGSSGSRPCARACNPCRREALAAIASVAPLVAAQAAAAEREECARIAERRASEGVASAALALAGTDYMRGMTDTSEAVARAIRARGDKP